MRLDPADRNGIQSLIAAWFVRCHGMPGSAIAPECETIIAPSPASLISACSAWQGLASAVRSASYRTPYEDLDGYMRRWWFMPELYGERARLHQTLRSDRDRERHDHPWHFVSVILEGGYTEELLVPGDTIPTRQRFRAGDVLFRHAEHRHRLELEPGADCWTLVFTSPNVREWGFWTEDEVFIPWRQHPGGQL
jgi:hypothetical protein